MQGTGSASQHMAPARGEGSSSRASEGRGLLSKALRHHQGFLQQYGLPASVLAHEVLHLSFLFLCVFAHYGAFHLWWGGLWPTFLFLSWNLEVIGSVRLADQRSQEPSHLHLPGAGMHHDTCFLHGFLGLNAYSPSCMERTLLVSYLLGPLLF